MFQILDALKAIYSTIFFSTLFRTYILPNYLFEWSWCCSKKRFLVHLDQRSRWTIAITWRPSSVVCILFTFQAEPNLAGMFLGWSSTKLLFFIPVGYSIWLPGPIICSDWLKFQRSSSQKLMNWLNPNCKGKIIWMSFTKSLFSMPIGNPRWPPSQDID